MAKFIPLYPLLLNRYANSSALLDIFSEGVSVHPKDLENVGSGPGLEFQRISKRCPAFAVEFAALGLRSIRSHWSAFTNLEAGGVEISPECDQMFRRVQKLIDDTPNSVSEIRQSLMDP
jgi:hypothetical protein